MTKESMKLIPFDDIGSLPDGLRKRIKSIRFASRINVHPGDVFAENVLAADEIVFEPNSSAKIGDSSNEYIAIVARRIVFQDPVASCRIEIPYEPAIPGGHGANGTNGNPDGGNGGNGTRGSDGRALPPFFLIAEKIESLRSVEKGIPLRIHCDGVVGGAGGNGGNGADGRNGDSGRHGENECEPVLDPHRPIPTGRPEADSLDGSRHMDPELYGRVHCWCVRAPTSGERGGHAGYGGDAAVGGNGGPGGDVYFVGTPHAVQFTTSFQVFNRGGQPGSSGTPGQPGKRGFHGPSGHAPAGCSPAEPNRDGDPALPGRIQGSSPSWGKRGDVTLIYISNLDEI